MLHRVMVMATFLAFPLTATANELLLEWTEELRPGTTMLAVEHYLEDRGISPQVVPSFFTDQSRIATPQRDYLFCNDRLSIIIEGEQVDGARFNYWMTAFLATQRKYGDPTAVEYEEAWRQVKFVWELADDTTLYFLVRGAPPEAIIWPRELEHRPTAQPCY